MTKKTHAEGMACIHEAFSCVSVVPPPYTLLVSAGFPPASLGIRLFRRAWLTAHRGLRDT